MSVATMDNKIQYLWGCAIYSIRSIVRPVFCHIWLICSASESLRCLDVKIWRYFSWRQPITLPIAHTWGVINIICLEHLGTFQAINFYGHAEWVKTRSLICDSHLRIRNTPLECCMYRKVIRLQYFTPTCYVKNREYPLCMHTYIYDYLYPICSKQHCRQYACIVWLYHACSYTIELLLA